MSRDEPINTESARGTLLRPTVIVAILAFLAGLAVMATVIRFYDGVGPAVQPAVQAPAKPAAEAEPAAQAPVTGAPEAGDLATLSAREQTLASQLDSLEARIGAIDTASRAAAGYATRAEALMIAFAARRAVDRGLPLGYIQAQLRERFEASEPTAVGLVIRAARDPVTLEDLRLALDNIEPQLVASGPEESWGAAIRRQLSELVIVREASSPSPRPADRLLRARRMLNAGNVDGALGEISRMPGAGNAPSWVAAAKRYVEARRALDTLELAAIQGRSRAVGPARAASTGDAPALFTP